TFYCGVSGLVEVENRWAAVKHLDALPDGHYTLWHIPGGPLPLLAAEGGQDGVIPDPWAGWLERRPGADPRPPYFGPGHPALVALEVATRTLLETELEDDLVTVRRQVRDERSIGLSHLRWIGNHYRVIGFAAHPATERWWRRLRRRVRGVTTPVTRAG